MCVSFWSPTMSIRGSIAILMYNVVRLFDVQVTSYLSALISSVQSVSSVAQLCPTLCDPMNCSMPGLPVHHQLPEFTQTCVHWVSDAIQPSHPLSSPSPPAPNPSQQQSLFQWVNSSHEVAKVLEFQLEYHSFQRNPRVDLLAVQGTLKSVLQYHSSKASILQHSDLFIVQFSYPYMTTGKTIALNRWPLLAKWSLWFLICCQDWSKLSFQGVSVF